MKKRRITAQTKSGLFVGIGIASFITSIFMMQRAVPKAKKLIEEAEKNKGSKLTKLEKIKVAWKPYVPVIGAAAAGTVLIAESKKIDSKTIAGLAGAYAISVKDAKELKQKTEEIVGKGKLTTIEDKVAEERVNSAPAYNIIASGNGDTLCCELFTGNFFYSSPEQVEKAELIFNKRLAEERFMSLNDWYEVLGRPATQAGDLLGWSIDDQEIALEKRAVLKDGKTPCFAFGYGHPPKYDYDHAW